MEKGNIVITGIGIIAPNGIGKESFWQAQEQGINAISGISCFPTDRFAVNLGGEVKNFDPTRFLGPKGLRNLDRTTLLLLTASKQALDDAKVIIDDATTDTIGVCTGTTFSHFSSIYDFDKEVFENGLAFSNPALFPSNVMNAASSHVSIRFNIQGFNTTVSTGYSSGLEALKYSCVALETGKAAIVLSAGVDALDSSVYFGYNKLRYMAGIDGIPLCCPFDKRRNGPVLGEAAGGVCVEYEENARQRNIPLLARVRSVESFFDGYRMGKIHPQGVGLEKAIRKALDKAGVGLSDVDCIFSSADSDISLDRVEVKVLKRIFGKSLAKIPVPAVKSMIGETISAAGMAQVISCIGAMLRGVIPPTINYKEKDAECDIDCVPNKAQRKDIKIALITSFGPGGYNSAGVLEKNAGV